MIRSSLKRLARAALFSPLIPQRAWERLQHLSLQGMNIGGGSHVRGSGETWLLEQLAHVRVPGQRPVVVDAGANIGNYAEEVLRAFGGDVQLFCLEPSSGPFAKLQARLGKRAGVELRQVGLHDREERLVLHTDPDNSAMASLYPRDLSHLGMNLPREEVISLTTLDAFCRLQGIQRIDLLKLDLEGHELKALNGATALITASAVEVIQFEFGGCNLDSRTYFRDFFQLLSPRYQLYRLLSRGLARIPRYDERLEVFTTTNFVAVPATNDLASKWT